MRPSNLLAVALCTGLAGCAELRNPFTEPAAGLRYFFAEPTIVLVSASPDLLTYEYSRLYGNDFPHAVAAAERQCKHYGKRAQVASLVAKNDDRNWATFVCR